MYKYSVISIFLTSNYTLECIFEITQVKFIILNSIVIHCTSSKKKNERSFGELGFYYCTKYLAP